MTNLPRSVVLVFVVVSLASSAIAQSQLWIRQFGTVAMDFALAAAGDGLGGVYLAGVTSGSLAGPNAGGGDAWVARYDSTGNPQWVRQLGTCEPEGAYAAAPDGSGGVYLSGSTPGSFGGANAGSVDVWFAHYDRAGNLRWIRQLGSSGYDCSDAAAADGSGGLFVAGFTTGSIGGPSIGGQDAWVSRYDGAGNQLWIAQFGTSDWDETAAAAADGAGGVFVTGHTSGNFAGPNSGFSDAWVARYDGVGNQVWTRQLGSSGPDRSNAAVADSSGGVYLAGYTWGGLGGPNYGGKDAWVARYDSAGNLRWVRQLGTAVTDYAYAVASDGSGGVYLCGLTMASLAGPNAGFSDVWVAQYDRTGNQLWLHQFGTARYEGASAAVADGLGGVFLAGATDGSLGGPHVGGGDVWVSRYSGNLGTKYCAPAITNSLGVPGVLSATGSGVVMENSVTLFASDLPSGQIGYFLNSMAAGSIPNPGGSQGTLCLSGAIGRYHPAVGFPVQTSGNVGIFSLHLDLATTPTPTGFTSITTGQTWNFQAWYRDLNPGPTSNFTDAVSVTFN